MLEINLFRKCFICRLCSEMFRRGFISKICHLLLVLPSDSELLLQIVFRTDLMYGDDSSINIIFVFFMFQITEKV